MMPGDVIFIPPSATRVGVRAVAGPAIYELKSEKRVDRCSTLPAAIAGRRWETGSIERIQPSRLRECQYRFDVRRRRSAEMTMRQVARTRNSSDARTRCAVGHVSSGPSNTVRLRLAIYC